MIASRIITPRAKIHSQPAADPAEVDMSSSPNTAEVLLDAAVGLADEPPPDAGVAWLPLPLLPPFVLPPFVLPPFVLPPFVLPPFVLPPFVLPPPLSAAVILTMTVLVPSVLPSVTRYCPASANGIAVVATPCALVVAGYSA